MTSVFFCACAPLAAKNVTTARTSPKFTFIGSSPRRSADYGRNWHAGASEVDGLDKLLDPSVMVGG
jgi:hypothetical protein